MSEFVRELAKKNWYWDVAIFSNEDSYKNTDNSILEINLSRFLDKINCNKDMFVENVQFVKDEKFTTVFVIYKYLLTEDELKKSNIGRRKYFERDVKRCKEQANLEEITSGFPNEISKNLWTLRAIVDEGSWAFGVRTDIHPPTLMAVERGDREITDEMLRAIKKRFPSISIKTFTNGEREDF